mmetsp:Transcript_79890/g.156238  ORF Transcript_79890/g.156238 Transcript_79890/m.156238 type:complete len:236 (+) Transcript_79890:456-1163(+)
MLAEASAEFKKTPSVPSAPTAAGKVEGSTWLRLNEAVPATVPRLLAEAAATATKKGFACLRLSSRASNRSSTRCRDSPTSRACFVAASIRLRRSGRVAICFESAAAPSTRAATLREAETRAPSNPTVLPPPPPPFVLPPLPLPTADMIMRFPVAIEERARTEAKMRSPPTSRAIIRIASARRWSPSSLSSKRRAASISDSVRGLCTHDSVGDDGEGDNCASPFWPTGEEEGLPAF